MLRPFVEAVDLLNVEMFQQGNLRTRGAGSTPHHTSEQSSTVPHFCFGHYVCSSCVWVKRADEQVQGGVVSRMN